MKLLIKERNKGKSFVKKNSYSEEDSVTIINDDNFCVLNPYYKEYKINNIIINNSKFYIIDYKKKILKKNYNMKTVVDIIVVIILFLIKI